jgi:hypothetical protein
MVEDVFIDERIVKDDLSARQDLDGPHGEQIRCSRPRADEINFTTTRPHAAHLP